MRYRSKVEVPIMVDKAFVSIVSEEDEGSRQQSIYLALMKACVTGC
jgi:hypothetical protein